MRRLLTVLTLSLVCPVLMAQASRTWVSGVGDDANPCSRTAPCKTFAGAISKTAPAGEIDALDPGGFGAVTITKAMTIDGGGNHASILGAGSNAIVVAAGASDRVILRNLSLNGIGTGLNGVRFISGGTLTIVRTIIFGFTQQAVDVALTASGELNVHESVFVNNTNGVRMATTAGQLLCTFHNAEIRQSANIGMEAFATSPGVTFVNVFDSNISHNKGDGIRATNAGTVFNLEGNLIAFNNSTAVNAMATGATIRLNNNTIVNNAVAFGQGGSAVLSSTGSNRVDGNGTQGATPTINYITR